MVTAFTGANIMGNRARIWTIILVLLILYLVINNYGRLSGYGSDLLKMWPFFSIAIGFLILFRRKGRPKNDFFTNNPKVNEELEKINRQVAQQDTK